MTQRCCGVDLGEVTGPWLINESLSPDELRKELHDFRRSGYRLTTLNGYSDNGNERYQTLWVKGTSPEWDAMFGLSTKEFETAVADFEKKGYYPTKLCGYVIGCQTKFSVIFEKRCLEAVVTKLNLTYEQLKICVKDFNKLGCWVGDLNNHTENGRGLLSCIFEKPLRRIYWFSNHTDSTLLELIKKNHADGYVMHNLYGMEMNGTGYFTGVFEKSSRVIDASWGLSYKDYMHKRDIIIAQKWSPIHVHAYASGSSVKYCIVWEK